MDTPKVIKIKRRLNGASGPPSTLQNGELAFNEIDNILYYGKNTDSNGNAINIIPIAGEYTNVLKDASIQTITTPLTATDQYLVISVNGVQKAIRLSDF
jgi:hypothetical protein